MVLHFIIQLQREHFYHGSSLPEFVDFVPFPGNLVTMCNNWISRLWKCKWGQCVCIMGKPSVMFLKYSLSIHDDGIHINVVTIRTLYVGFEVLTAVVMKSTIFWDITPCCPLKVNRRFGGTYRLFSACFHAGSCSAYSSTLKMEAICSSETSVEFQPTTWRYIPEESTLRTLQYAWWRSHRYKRFVRNK
jgi:hypothetical protein